MLMEEHNLNVFEDCYGPQLQILGGGGGAPTNQGNRNAGSG
jgi:hypothetical protein